MIADSLPEFLRGAAFLDKAARRTDRLKQRRAQQQNEAWFELTHPQQGRSTHPQPLPRMACALSHLPRFDK